MNYVNRGDHLRWKYNVLSTLWWSLCCTEIVANIFISIYYNLYLIAVNGGGCTVAIYGLYMNTLSNIIIVIVVSSLGEMKLFLYDGSRVVFYPYYKIAYDIGCGWAWISISFIGLSFLIIAEGWWDWLGVGTYLLLGLVVKNSLAPG